MYKKIAFIKSGNFSNTNHRVIEILQKHFSDYQVDVIDIYDILMEHKLVLILNVFHSIKEYHWKMLSSKKQYLWYFFSSSYLFSTVKTLILKYIDKENYVFSLQTQSTFDTSIKGVPHFVYTDNVELANLYYPNLNKNNLLPQSRIELESTVFHNATKNFTMSTNVKKAIVEKYNCDPEKVVCIYAGSNVKVSNSKSNARSYENKHILFVGIDWERKGGPTLVKAFKLVLQKYPDAQLTIVGCSPNLDIPNCTVVGRVTLEKIVKYYENASIFCLPTTFEPFGIVFIEALMYKLPVIGTDIGAIPDFVINGENGYLVKPNDIEQLATVLMLLLADPNKCRSFGEKGYQIALERYSWENVGYQMKQIIESILNSD